MIFGEGPIVKNIAGDLNKLFLQGTRAGQPINNVEGDAAADQGTIQLMADRDPVIRDISTGLGWLGREVTVSGTGALQLVNSLGRPLKSWSVELAPYQEGSGDPSPENVRPIHGTDKITVYSGGVNLLDFIVRTQNGIASTKTNGVVHIAGTATATAYPVDFIPIMLPAGTYVWSISGLPAGAQCIYTSNGAWAGYVTQGRTITITTPKTIGGYITIPTGASVDAEIKIQLEFGNVTSDFTPYIGIIQTVITLPHTAYSDTVGSVSSEARDAAVNMGDLTWTRTPVDGAEWYYFSARLIGCPVVNYDDPVRLAIMAEMFKPTDTLADSLDLTLVSNNTMVLSRGVANAGIRIRADQYTSVEDFLTAVNGKLLIYPLATPIEYALPSANVPTTEGDGSIWVTAEDGIVTSFSATYLQGE